MVDADGNVRVAPAAQPYAPQSVADQVATRLLADALADGHTTHDDLRKLLTTLQRVPRLLLAPLVHAFAVGADASESPYDAEMRRAAYVDKAMANDACNIRRSQGVDAVALEELQSQISKDVPRTIPRGFESFFGDARVQKLLFRIVSAKW